jgi:hypothetical protein
VPFEPSFREPTRPEPGYTLERLERLCGGLGFETVAGRCVEAFRLLSDPWAASGEHPYGLLGIELGARGPAIRITVDERRGPAKALLDWQSGVALRQR